MSHSENHKRTISSARPSKVLLNDFSELLPLIAEDPRGNTESILERKRSWWNVYLRKGDYITFISLCRSFLVVFLYFFNSKIVMLDPKSNEIENFDFAELISTFFHKQSLHGKKDVTLFRSTTSWWSSTVTPCIKRSSRARLQEEKLRSVLHRRRLKAVCVAPPTATMEYGWREDSAPPCLSYRRCLLHPLFSMTVIMGYLEFPSNVFANVFEMFRHHSSQDIVCCQIKCNEFPEGGNREIISIWVHWNNNNSNQTESIQHRAVWCRH